MENLEYLQLSMNYYSAAERITAPSNNEDSTVWKGLQNYLERLTTQGWVMIKETKSNSEQSRTYHLKRPVA